MALTIETMTGIPIIPLPEFIERAEKRLRHNIDISLEDYEVLYQFHNAVLFYSRLLQTPLREDMFVRPKIQRVPGEPPFEAYNVDDPDWLPMFEGDFDSIPPQAGGGVYLSGLGAIAFLRDEKTGDRYSDFLVEDIAELITLNPSWIKRENEDVFKILSDELPKMS